MTYTLTKTQFYTWNKYQAAYEEYQPTNPQGIPLLLIHPVGVGLSRLFWQRFTQIWYKQGGKNRIYNPDLLGCGESDKPSLAYYPTDSAQQLKYFIETIIRTPVIVIVQGALLSVALHLINQTPPHLIKGLILSGPPAWNIITYPIKITTQRLTWNLLTSPLGDLFYLYARRKQFLKNFSIKQLFDNKNQVDDEWLENLRIGSNNLQTRYAVFSFLSGFWREDHQPLINKITQPTWVVIGAKASSISKEGKTDTPDNRLQDYLTHFPNAQGTIIPGRNVLPYENTLPFVEAIASFVQNLS